MCVYVHEWHSTIVKDNLQELFCFLPWGSWGWSMGLQVWSQTDLPTEPSHSPIVSSCHLVWHKLEIALPT